MATLKERCEEYSALRSTWQTWLMGATQTSVWQQTDVMIEEEIWFKTINIIRNRAGNPNINEFLWRMFLTGYVYKQAFAIRRLVDADKSSVSLINIVKGIRDKADLLTREVIVGYDGTPMTIEEPDGSEEWARDANGLSTRGVRWQNYLSARRKHAAFDRMRAGKPVGEDRQPDDRVADEVIQRLEAALAGDSIGRVKHLCNKALAHADLKGVLSEKSPTYNDIHASVQVLVELQQFLAVDFLCVGSTAIVATHEGNQFQLLSAPLVPHMEEAVYEEIWGENAKQMESWGEAATFRSRFALHLEEDAADAGFSNTLPWDR